MDKNAIKKYAVWARRELISRVSQKALQYGITDKDIVPVTATSVNGVVLSAEELKQRKSLVEQINSKGYEQVMEEVAYIWFNRFCALRFMEVNGYLPSHVRVFTDEDNNFKPQILAEAINLELDGLDMEKVYALKDANDNDALFKYLVIVQCNALNPILPGIFQRISDYTELLFPENLLREGSVIQQIIEMVPEEDWQDAVQSIGWLYQFYNSEKKDEVFAALKKNVKITKENIPAATQLFTPDWIVRYMVENSLGRLWVDGHPSDELKSEWKYYMDEVEQEADVQVQLASIRKEYASITPEQIKCIDPCAGSGHILAYMFDVLMQIYEAYGYTAHEAVRSIIKNNIYGLDIDDRAAQLAYFTIMMKARQYDRRFLTRKDEDDNPDVPQPHIFAIVESNGIDSFALDYFVNDDPKLKEAMNSLIKELRDAKEYGSILNITSVDFEALYTRLNEVRNDISMNRETVLNELLPLIQVAEIMSQKYDAVITNPPYMSSSGMGTKLAEFTKKEFPNTKSDMSTVFMERTLQLCTEFGYMAMINIPVWMTLKSFEKFRIVLLQTTTISNLVHFGRGIFGSDFGTTAFVFSKKRIKNYKTLYRKLYKKQGAVSTVEEKEELFFTDFGRYVVAQEKFNGIDGSPIAYALKSELIDAFRQDKKVSDLGTTRLGMTTADNNKFTRLWFEVERDRFIENAISAEEVMSKQKKWVPYNKGGQYRKWYGNNDVVVNWENDGFEIRNFADEKGHIRSTVPNTEYYFRECITWSKVTAGSIAFRYRLPGSIFDVAGACLFSNELHYLHAFLNSKVALSILNVLSPTMNYEGSHIAALPVKKASDVSYVVNLVKENIQISKADWDSFETSWEFKRHPLVEIIHKGDTQFEHGNIYLSKCYQIWESECEERFNQLKANEEEINSIFINIYGLQEELLPEVEDKDVTIRLADKKRDIKNLISYAVGCMFGRYSLDVEGIAYAGGEWNESNYSTFKVDKDSIIPICDDEYFADDIVGRFVNFIEIVYGKQSLNENLQFIAGALGGSGQSKDVIRKYLMDEFYIDHCAMYSGNMGKRPIYWLFDSGKKGGFRALVYMHRYQPDTIARMRTDYVHEQQSRYRTAIADLEQRIASATTSERVNLSKRLKTLQEQAIEIQGYEEEIHHLADQYISIDLDDGVKKNYEIFKDVLAKIK